MPCIMRLAHYPCQTARHTLGEGGLSDRTSRRQEGFREISDPRNGLLSALIAIPELAPLISPNSFGNVAIFPRPSEPELPPEQPDSPVINTRQEIISRKKGGICTEHLG